MGDLPIVQQAVGQISWRHNLTAIKLSVVGAGHARDEEIKTKHCSPNIAGMARSYGGIVLNLMAVGHSLANSLDAMKWNRGISKAANPRLRRTISRLLAEIKKQLGGLTYE